MNPIIYVILNGSLNMSAGKAAAQTAHAVMMLENKHREKFISNYRRTVIVLEATGRQQLEGIVDYLYDADIKYEYYVDEGVNEVEAFSFTALAVEPFDADDEKKREIFSRLPLYGVPKVYEEDEYAGVTCESEESAANRTIFDISRRLSQMDAKLVQLTQPKPESAWRKFWTYRTRPGKGWVS